VFAIVAMAAGAFVACAILLGLDVYEHARLERYAALNIWGYRGPVVGRKRDLERRIVVIGGSTVLGLGLPWNEAFPAQLERRLRAWGVDASVVNLGVDGENAFAFGETVRDYAYLQYDGVIFYEGYNNLLGTVPFAIRHGSWMFRASGYWPILPTAISEKVMLWRYHGDLNAAYAERKKTVFRPLERRDLAGSLQEQIGSLTGPPRERDAPACEERWAIYCDMMAAAIGGARDRHARVLVVTQPYISDAHVEQQNALRAMLRLRFGGDPEVRYANLGQIIDLHDRSLAYDGMHLTARGNEVVAGALLAPAAALVGQP
jgi:lysophospholipase L1-like esterase